jgi:hypothetical protein
VIQILQKNMQDFVPPPRTRVRNLNFSLLVIMALSADMLVHVAPYLGPLETARLALCSQSAYSALVGSEHFSACSDWVRHRIKFSSCLRAVKKIGSEIYDLNGVCVHVRKINNKHTRYTTRPREFKSLDKNGTDSSFLTVKTDNAVFWECNQRKIAAYNKLYKQTVFMTRSSTEVEEINILVFPGIIDPYW